MQIEFNYWWRDNVAVGEWQTSHLKMCIFGMKINLGCVLGGFCLFVCLFGSTHGMQQFPGQGSNLWHRSDPSHSRENAGSLTHWATRGLLKTQVLTCPKWLLYGNFRDLLFSLDCSAWLLSSVETSCQLCSCFWTIQN